MSPHNVYQLRYYSYLILKIKRRTDGKFNTDIKYNNCQGLFNFFIFQQYVYFILNLFPARVFKNIFLNLAQRKSIYNLFLSDENVFLSPKNCRKKSRGFDKNVVVVPFKRIHLNFDCEQIDGK